MAKKKKAAKKSSKSSKAVIAKLKITAGRLPEQVLNLLPTEAGDIIAAIKHDHIGLRNYLAILKDTDEDMTERRRAYKAFSVLLKSHSEAEEKIVYKVSEGFSGRELHIKIEEGYVEHQLATDLMARLEAARDPMVWSAHANVLSEIVEHHLKEEERDLLPMIRQKSSDAENMKMLSAYLKLRAKTQRYVVAKNAGALK